MKTFEGGKMRECDNVVTFSRRVSLQVSFIMVLFVVEIGVVGRWVLFD